MSHIQHMCYIYKSSFSTSPIKSCLYGDKLRVAWHKLCIIDVSKCRDIMESLLEKNLVVFKIISSPGNFVTSKCSP